jgi:hypothetical protein
LSPSSRAQNATPNLPQLDQNQRTEYLRRAVSAAHRNDALSVERELAELGMGQAGSHRWHMDMGLNLLIVVHQAPRTGRTEILSVLVASALQHLVQADAKGVSPIEKAAAHGLMGILHERFTGNMEAAIASYRAAVTLNPRHEEALRARERLERTQANLRRVQK